MKTRHPVRIQFQWFGSVDEGRQLELLAVDEAGTPLSDHCYPLITLFKDEVNEKLNVELYTKNGTVQIYAKDLTDALALAEEEAHSERWYEDNVYSKIDTEPDAPSNSRPPTQGSPSSEGQSPDSQWTASSGGRG